MANRERGRGELRIARQRSDATLILINRSPVVFCLKLRFVCSKERANILAALHCDLHADHSVRAAGENFNPAKKAGTSVDQIERFMHGICPPRVRWRST